jgi:hypothetical protein
MARFVRWCGGHGALLDASDRHALAGGAVLLVEGRHLNLVGAVPESERLGEVHCRLSGGRAPDSALAIDLDVHPRNAWRAGGRPAHLNLCCGHLLTLHRGDKRDDRWGVLLRRRRTDASLSAVLLAPGRGHPGARRGTDPLRGSSGVGGRADKRARELLPVLLGEPEMPLYVPGTPFFLKRSINDRSLPDPSLDTDGSPRGNRDRAAILEILFPFAGERRSILMHG